MMMMMMDGLPGLWQRHSCLPGQIPFSVKGHLRAQPRMLKTCSLNFQVCSGRQEKEKKGKETQDLLECLLLGTPGRLLAFCK